MVPGCFGAVADSCWISALLFSSEKRKSHGELMPSWFQCWIVDGGDMPGSLSCPLFEVCRCND